MLRVQGLPATLTAFITSMAVLFQSVITSARTGVVLEARARPTIAAFSMFIVASFSDTCVSFDDFGRGMQLPCCFGFRARPRSAHASQRRTPRYRVANCQLRQLL